MELNDYETPDPYAPRPRASQQVAAQKRARQDSERTTTESPAPKGLPLAPIALIVGGVLLIGILSYGLSRSTTRPLQFAPTDMPARAFAPAPPTTAPAPTPAPQPTTSPTVPTAPPVAAPEPLEQTGQGLTVEQPAAPVVVIEQAPPPPPTEAPVLEWPTSAPASPPDFAKPDIKDRCQFIGCLGQQAVDLARAQACHALYWQYGSVDPEVIPEPDLSAVRGCIWEGLYR